MTFRSILALFGYNFNDILECSFAKFTYFTYLSEASSSDEDDDNIARQEGIP
jgi:hypothetical protein